MESLSEQEAMRVLQAAAAMDAVRASGPRPNALAANWSPGAQHQQQQATASESTPVPSQGLCEDVWRELTETDSGELKRHGDLDSWTDVFRATASSVRDAWRHVECLSYESLAFGWLALARKHEALQVVPAAAASVGEDVSTSGGTDSPALPAWLNAAQWAQAAYRAGDLERLLKLLGLQAADVVAFRPDTSGLRPAFFLAAHHDSRTVRVVVRGGGHLRDLLTSVAGHSTPLGAGFAHHGMLSSAQQLLQEEAGVVRAALDAHPGYGLHFIGHSLGAGTAALLALLVTTDSSWAQQLGCPPNVKATCFAAPPVVTAELAEQCASYIESIVYNADLVSRCSVLSLRRLANDMSAASEEVLARSELAQALRRSGALGLANHLVAAALCRCQPQEAGAGALSPAPSATLPRPAAAEGMSLLSGALSRTLPTAAPIPAQPSGRAGSLASLGSQPKPAAVAAAAGSSTAEFVKAPTAAAAAAAPAVPSSPSAATPAPGPMGPPSGTLPPLLAIGGGAAARPTGDSPHRKPSESQGVLSPPPLVAAAAAAASASAQIAVPAAAMGPTPTRRCLVGSLGDLKHGLQPEGRAASLTSLSTISFAAGEEGNLGAAGARPWPDGSTTGGVVVLEPLPAPPMLPGATSIGSGQRREGGGSVEGQVVAAPAPPAPAALPPLLLPPLLLPGVGGSSASQSRCQSPKASRQASVRDPLLPPALPAVSPTASEPSPGERLGPGRGVPLAESVQSPRDPPTSTARSPQQHTAEVMEAVASPAPEYQELLVPGCLHVIERKGADATASFRLLRDLGRMQLNRILLKRSMLRDHLLSHYIAALERVSQQQQQH